MGQTKIRVQYCKGLPGPLGPDPVLDPGVGAIGFRPGQGRSRQIAVAIWRVEDALFELTLYLFVRHCERRRAGGGGMLNSIRSGF